MKNIIRKTLILALTLALTAQLSGCGLITTKKERYANYVRSMMDANYKADFDEFLSLTKLEKADCETAYNQGIEYLTVSLIKYYGIELVDNGEIKESFTELTKRIYAETKYEVKNAVKSGDGYTVEVLVYPMDLLQVTYDDVIAYINAFNDRKNAGEFDKYEIEEYEVEFAKGIHDILSKSLDSVSYLAPVSTVVGIIEAGDTYSISDADFTKLNSHLIATADDTYEPENEPNTQDGD